MKSWPMLACALLVVVAIVLVAAGAGAFAFIAPLGCVLMMGMMIWMMCGQADTAARRHSR